MLGFVQPRQTLCTDSVAYPPVLINKASNLRYSLNRHWGRVGEDPGNEVVSGLPLACQSPYMHLIEFLLGVCLYRLSFLLSSRISLLAIPEFSYVSFFFWIKVGTVLTYMLRY